MQRRRWSFVLTPLLLVGALAWCFSSPSGPPVGPPEPAQWIEPVRAPVVLTASAQRPSERPAPIQPVDSAEENRVGMPSHPLTREHQRIFRENNLIGDLNGAMDIGDVAGLRTRLAQYREEYPEDAHVLQDGYELIADCLEHPSPETTAKAQRYYDEELASGLRRYIRRHCLEASNR